MAEVTPMQNERTSAKASVKAPHYHGHRQRLRERFLTHGGDSLADYELLEMLLFAASPRGDVKPLAKALIEHFGSFKKVLQAEINALSKVEGCGESAIAAMKLVQASAQRLLAEELTELPLMANWQALLDYCRTTMGHLKKEQFRILFLNHKNRLIANELQQEGTVNHAPVYVREVIKRALELQASALILVHNHPSGDTTPSQADIDITKHIANTGKPLGVAVHDHLIISDNSHFSFKSYGLM